MEEGGGESGELVFGGEEVVKGAVGEEDGGEAVGELELAHVGQGDEGTKAEGVGFELEAVEHGGGDIKAVDLNAAFEEV